ncbi:MAG: ferrous iron transport protein B [Bacteroidales bacterium]|nr:ferrous iron transport protein B [Bacteroidales bacterium]
MLLSELKPGEKAIIIRVKGRGSFRKRILEMGFVKGKIVEYLQQAPLNDPIAFKVMDSEVTLRKSEASLIEVEYFNQELNIRNPNATTFEQILEEIPTLREKSHTIHVALVGNPNSGKTTLFNYCTGLREHVGNYSGVTVDLKKGTYRYKNYIFEITDLPGTYSLAAYTPEELYVRNHLMNELPDVIINVIDSSNLERNLFLTTQLIDMDMRVVVALNMFDELEKKGDHFNYSKLGAMLGIPMVPTVSSKGRGIFALFDQVIEIYEDKNSLYRHIHIYYGENIENAIELIQNELKKNRSFLDRYSSRYVALKLLEKDKDIENIINKCPNYKEIKQIVERQIKHLEKDFGESVETIITDAKYGFIEGALKETYKKNKQPLKQISKKIDKVLINRYLGLPIFFSLLWLTFEGTFFIGQYPVMWIEKAVELLSTLANNNLPDSIFKDLLIDGIFNGVGGVLVFLPNILLLFFFIAIMEDTGYMARAAFIMDKVMHIIGLHGKSFIPLFMGFGCNVPAIMATRTIESRNDRIVTMLINPFMSCSARLPIYILITSTFFNHHAGTVIFLIYIVGILLAGIISLLFKKTFFKKNEVPFVMELPPYRIPTSRNLLRHMWQKAKQYLKKMSGIILVASIIIWTLSYYPFSPKNKPQIHKIEQQIHNKILSSEQKQDLNKLYIAYKQYNIQYSYLGQIGKTIEPIMAPLGFDWRITVSLLTGISGKEVVVSTMAVLFNENDLSNNQTSLNQAILKAKDSDGNILFSIPTIFAFLMFVLIYFPCVAVIAAIKKESDNWKWAIFEIIFTTSLAWFIAFLTKNILTWLL